ncbi:MAG: 1,4-dihydroxy-2-naphthoate polyprenyltransferase [Anaerolineales bacterium]|nr:1,4-dihydroxy-2-naphthoate polyprenyltransferase [Anaerolineales bacterium]MCB9128179.1 1,4-dihydroxy-2-naphthoate polyprenyltransferase [Ardenticatenales bacterium]MCB9171888.1 1,4-dihydroxy-2-naphthoate polyprenyltransferase [Ardenticatenales bacterium]
MSPADGPLPRATPSRGQAWLLASRPKTLPAAAAPVLVGSALAWHDNAFHGGAALAALLAALLIQIGTNFVNDLYDFRKGADTDRRLGPTRATSAGWLSERAMVTGIGVSFGLAALLGLYLILRGGLPILAVGIASLISGWAYTAGPFPLGYNGLGDLFVFLFFGIIAVVGSYYVQALTTTPVAYLAALPMGALITNILAVNNTRDAETDQLAGKRTLAVLLGKGATRLEYALLNLVAYALPLWLWWRAEFALWILLPLLTLPRAAQLTRTLWRSNDGPTLNGVLAATGQLVLLYALLFALGMVAG